MSIRPLPPAPTRDDPTNFSAKADALLAALPGFVDDCNALEQSMLAASSLGTSGTSLSISSGTKSLLTQPERSWQVGMNLYVLAATAPSNMMVARITAYDDETGSLSVDVLSFSGAGTFGAWLIGLSVPQAQITTTMIADEVVTEGKLARGARYDAGQWVLSMRATPPKWTLAPDGRTIGNAASGATSRANVDTIELYTVLWEGTSNADLIIQDSAGVNTTRGASAALDFSAGKRMPLPTVQNGDALLVAVASAVGARTAGQVIEHGHGATVHDGGYHQHIIGIGTSEGNDLGTATNGTGRNADLWSDGGGEHSHGITIGNTGGSRNLAAGLYTRVYIAM